jgi:cytochrome b561
MIRTLAFAAVLLAGPAYAAPAVWKVDAAKSKIAFSGTAPEGAFTGTFGKWTADIKFSPKELPASSAAVTIVLDSARVPDPTGTASLKEDDWFYKTTAIKSLGANKYEADGVLTIRNKAVPTKLPFTLAIAGKTATMNATLNLDRFAFDVGKPIGEDLVSKVIKVDIAVVATTP